MSHSLFQQTVIAIIWDFDKTLSPNYMQQPLFRHFGVDEATFWKESDGLAEVYKREGIHHVSKDLLYLNHILAYVNARRFEGLNNALLFELGAEIELYEGLPDFFKLLKDDIENTDDFAVHGITVEHYIVSTGLYQMIMGSRIAPYVKDVWGCEFSESAGEPGYFTRDGQAAPDKSGRVIQSIGYSIEKTDRKSVV